MEIAAAHNDVANFDSNRTFPDKISFLEST